MLFGGSAIAALVAKWGAIIAAIFGAIVGVYFKGRRAGVKAQRDKLAKATKDTQDKFDAIDKRPDSFDDAVGRLTVRSTRHQD